MRKVIGAVPILLALAVAGCMDAAEAKKELDAANKLWDEGKKAEAVQKYERVINNRMTAIEKDDQPKVFQRVIEFKAEKGDADAAKKMLAKALENKVPLDLKEPKAQELLAKVKTDQEDKKAQEQERQARREQEERERLAHREQEERDRQAKQEAEQRELDAPLKVTAEEIFKDYADNKINTAKKYRAKQRLEVTGTIETVNTVFGKPFVLLKPEENRFQGVQCMFTTDQADQLASLKKGERVTIKGRFQHKFGNVVVEGCELAGPGKAVAGAERKTPSQPKAGGKGAKLAAFRAVVNGWEGYPEVGGEGGEKYRKWAGETETRQKAFIDIPFDASANEEEAKAIFNLYKDRLTNIGKIMQTLSITGGTETAFEEAMWKRLSAHLTPIFKSVATKER